MGYSYRGEIKSFWPDDTDTEFYITNGATFADILDRIMKKWGPAVVLDNVTITPEHIHTECLTYDLHDPNDYTDFLKVTLKR